MAVNPFRNCVLGDVYDSVEDAIGHLHAIRKSDHYLKVEDRYSFTNDADAIEVEQAICRLKNAMQLLQSLPEDSQVECEKAAGE